MQGNLFHSQSESFAAPPADEYEALVDRYKTKRTTDDCYTPANLYEAVLKWATDEYHIEGRPVVRPFFPGGDYESFTYPANSVVIDNPPFSILSKIIKFYAGRGIDFFLFAPTLTCFNAGRDLCNYVITDVTVTYHNGAKIRTSFVTSLGEYAILALPEIDAMLTRCEEENTGRKVRKLMGIDFPADVATTSNISAIVRRGFPYKVRKGETKHISSVGTDRVSIFGGGMLLSKRAVEEKERSDAEAESRRCELRRQVELSSADRKKQAAIGRPPEQELFSEGTLL